MSHFIYMIVIMELYCYYFNELFKYSHYYSDTNYELYRHYHMSRFKYLTLF